MFILTNQQKKPEWKTWKTLSFGLQEEAAELPAAKPASGFDEGRQGALLEDPKKLQLLRYYLLLQFCFGGNDSSSSLCFGVFLKTSMFEVD